MKLSILAVSIFTAAISAAAVTAKNATRPNPTIKLPAPKVNAVAASSQTPWLFNLAASDGTYLGLEYASDGAYLLSTPSPYTFFLNGTTLVSTSTDILSVDGAGDIFTAFVQPDVEDYTPVDCRFTGVYPDIQLSCSVFGYNAEGDLDGYFVLGTGGEVKTYGATFIDFTVVPYCAACT